MCKPLAKAPKGLGVFIPLEALDISIKRTLSLTALNDGLFMMPQLHGAGYQLVLLGNFSSHVLVSMAQGLLLGTGSPPLVAFGW